MGLTLKQKLRKRKWAWDKKNPSKENDLYWNAEYKHYFRDVGEKGRIGILKALQNKKLDPEKKSIEHLKIILKKHKGRSK